MPLYHVIDDALTNAQIDDVRNFSFDNVLDVHTEEEGDDYFIFSPGSVGVLRCMIDIASRFYDLSDTVCYEIWERINDRPYGWHYDKDEDLADQGKLVFPLCTIVYYLDVGEDLHGGRFVVFDPIAYEKQYVEPRKNRLLIVDPGVFHCVERFVGDRHSIICNPWAKMYGK